MFVNWPSTKLWSGRCTVTTSKQ